MTQTRSAVVFTNGSTGPSQLLDEALRQTGITPVLPHQLPGNSNGVSMIIIERPLERAETICSNLRKYQEYAQMPILVLADTVDPSRLPRFKELKAVVLQSPLTATAVREFLTKRLSELSAAESRAAMPQPPPAASKQPDAPKRAAVPPPKAEPPPATKKVEPQPTPFGAGTHTPTPTPNGAPAVTPRPPAASEPPPRPAAVREVRKAVRPEKDREDEVPTSAQLLRAQPDASALPSGSVRCGHCPRWHVRREDAFCSRCGSRLIALNVSPATITFEPRSSHTVGALVTLNNVGQNPLRMAFRIIASGELADRLLMSAPAAILPGGASGDLLVELDARGLDLSGSYEATLEIITNEGPHARYLIPLFVERLPRPRVIPRGEYVYSLNELHQPNQWEFGLANEGGGTLRLQGVKMMLPGYGDSALELLGPSPVAVGGEPTVKVGVRLPELKLPASSYSGKLTFLFEQSNPVTLDLGFEAKRPRYLTVQPSEFIDFGVVSTRRPQTFTLQLRNTGVADSLTVESAELKPPYPWATFKNTTSFPADITPSGTLFLELQLDGSGVTPDAYDGELVVRSNSYGNPVQSIPFGIEFKEPKVFDGYMGIDFGTTASCVAVLEKNILRPLAIDQYGVASEADGILMPSVLYFFPDGKVLAGRAAQGYAQLDPTNAVRAIKRELGVREKQQKGGRDYEPTELAALVIKDLRERAEHALFKAEEYKTPRRAVLTVPVDFAEKQRRALLEASSQAGLNNYALDDHPTVLDEALAVALYYQRKRAEARPATGDAERVLVFDFGGGTLDCGLIEIRYANQKTTFETLATYGDSHLGGEDIDWALVKLLGEMAAQEFPELDQRYLEKKPPKISRLYRTDETRRAAAAAMRNAFKDSAERAKIALCTKEETLVTISPLLHQKPPAGNPYVTRDNKEAVFEATLRQEDFERMLAPFLDRAIRVIEVLCSRARLAPKDVHTILHAGRSSFTPVVKRRVKEFLPNATDRTELIEPKVCVALGAACFGRIKTYPTESFEIIGGANRVAHDIGYIDLDQESGSEVFVPVITAQTPFPTEKEVRMRCGGRAIDLQVAENRGMGNSVSDNPDLAYGDIVRLDPRGPAEEETPVLFKVNDDGLLEVLVNGEVQRIIDISE
ncbi:MAG: molecular chaperone DnaK [Acidobacteriota bacterium]|jgi:molecular chaperone DnaK (HSP70)|nr:molecular chaperone DnaK [Acidobacteriota bacterium]